MKNKEHPLYVVWRGMKDRCGRKGNKAYKHYGGRGVKVCERWRNDFWAFVEDMGERPEGASLDRIDNNGDYEPGNVRWASQKEQCRNRRDNSFYTYRGETKCLSEWSEELGMTSSVISYRLKTRGDVRGDWSLRGERHPLSKLTKQQVIEIRERARTESQVELAKEFGVSASLISRIMNGKAWKHA